MGFRPFASLHRFRPRNGFETELSSKNPAGKFNLETERETERYMKEEVFAFLDAIRESGKINMFGAGPVVQEVYGLSRHEARDLVLEWMESFGKNSRQENSA